MSDAPLLFDPPSQRLGGTHPAGGSSKASASPNASHRRVSGSNSILAVCHCGGEFEVRAKSQDLPNHHAPDEPGFLKQVCHGSGRRANVFVEA